jgi:hypothetical protein
LLYYHDLMRLLVAALAGPFIIKGPNGKLLMNLDRVGVPAISLPALAKAAATVMASTTQALLTPVHPVPWERSPI